MSQQVVRLWPDDGLGKKDSKFDTYQGGERFPYRKIT